MTPPPPGWPRLSSALFYEEPVAAIDFLCRAFGFTVQIKVLDDSGRLAHSELIVPGGLIMVGGAGAGSARAEATHRQSPRALGGANTQCLMMFVDDADTHCAHARAQGARILAEPRTTDYGEEYWTDRGYEAEDLEGHRWWFVQRLRTPKPA
jgi:uncharacterized glyoxalase superfamily protein PhnB